MFYTTAFYNPNPLSRTPSALTRSSADHRLSVGLAQMFEKVLEVGIVYARNDAGTHGYRHVAVLLLKGREDVANLCNDLLHSGIRFLEKKRIFVNIFNLIKIILIEQKKS